MDKIGISVCSKDVPNIVKVKHRAMINLLPEPVCSISTLCLLIKYKAIS